MLIVILKIFFAEVVNDWFSILLLLVRAFVPSMAVSNGS